MDRFAKAMSRSVKDFGGIAGALQHGRGRSIHFPSSDSPTVPCRVLHQLDRGISSVGDGGERACITLRHMPSRVPYPGDVRKNGSLTVDLAPQIEEHQLVSRDRARLRRGRQIVWIAGILH